MPEANQINDLNCQTALCAPTDAKGDSGAVANHPTRVTTPVEVGRRLQRKNLDVPRTSHDREIGRTKDVAAELDQSPLLSSLGSYTVQPAQQLKHYRPGGTRYLMVAQATNIIDAVEFAKSIGLRLVAHLTIHWSLTDAGDDPEGKLFAKVREGLSKWLHRKGIVFAAAWARERQSSAAIRCRHCHLLFHLPVEYPTGAKLLQLEAAIYRLINRHGGAYWDERVIKLVIHDNPDGKYLIKGGGPKVWKLFGLRKEHRRLQGIIHGKRCGTTQNLGPAARRRAAAKREKA